MILTAEHIPQIQKLHQTVYKKEPPIMDKKWFDNKVVFGIMHENRLVSSVSIDFTKSSNLVIMRRLRSDPTFPNHQIKQQCSIECANYLYQHHLSFVRFISVRVQRFLTKGMEKYNPNEINQWKRTIIEEIPIGSMSRFAWVNEFYHDKLNSNEPQLVELLRPIY